MSSSREIICQTQCSTVICPNWEDYWTPSILNFFLFCLWALNNFIFFIPLSTNSLLLTCQCYHCHHIDWSVLLPVQFSDSIDCVLTIDLPEYIEKPFIYLSKINMHRHESKICRLFRHFGISTFCVFYSFFLARHATMS